MLFKGKPSRNFEVLQVILMNRIGIPDVPLKVYSFINFRFYIVILGQSFDRVKLLLMHLAKA